MLKKRLLIPTAFLPGVIAGVFAVVLAVMSAACGNSEPSAASATSAADELPGAAASAEGLNTLTPEERQEGYRLLFNGRDLTGWRGEPGYWSVRGGAIVGSSLRKHMTSNTFLISGDEYADFALKLDIKVRNNNSGIQFRSEVVDGWTVRGYQADAAVGKWWGALYGEQTDRGVIVDGWAGKGEHLVKEGDWNLYEITCRGNHITLALNGVVTVDTEDDMASSGIIALQLHRGPPMEVSFRNMKIKVLD